MKKLFLLLVFINSITIFAQKDVERLLKSGGYTNPDELVTLSASIPFEQAIEVLSEVSRKTTGQNIVSTAEFNGPVGIEIDKMHYKRALEIIVQYNNLLFEESPEVIVVKSKTGQDKKAASQTYAPVDSREVKISAVFFEANITKMKQRGINWQAILSQNGTTIGSSLSSFLAGGDSTDTEEEADLDFNVDVSSNVNIGSYNGTVEGVFQFFEEENLGEIISRPSINVRDGFTGRIQIGEDISIKQKDFAGNVTDVFFPTGTIIDVTPRVYNEDGVDYVLLKLSAERSSPTVISETTTRISKTNANTEVLMLDGEKTVIGGLIINEETNTRRGVPILKDLPWWVFGLKYIFGYTQEKVTQKEVIILLETEILPTLKERVADKAKDINLIQKRREENKKVIERYQRENMEKKDNANEKENNED